MAVPKRRTSRANTRARWTAVPPDLVPIVLAGPPNRAAPRTTTPMITTNQVSTVSGDCQGSG